MAISSKTPPQEYLDRMHDVDIPGLFTPKMTPRKRRTLVEQAQADLAKIDSRLQKQIELIKEQYPRRRRDEEAAQELIPYHMLKELLDQLIEAVDNLERTMNEGRMLPQGFDFPFMIFGKPETGEWFFGEVEDVQRWDQAESLKSRLGQLMEERGRIAEQINGIKEELNEAKDEQQKLVDTYNRRSPRGRIVFRMIVFFILSLVAAGVALVLLGGALVDDFPVRVMEDDAQALPIGGGAAVFALLMLLLMPLSYSGWKRGLENLQKKIEEQRQVVRAIQQRGKELQKRYRPVNDMAQETHTEFKELRATFGEPRR